MSIAEQVRSYKSSNPESTSCPDLEDQCMADPDLTIMYLSYYPKRSHKCDPTLFRDIDPAKCWKIAKLLDGRVPCFEGRIIKNPVFACEYAEARLGRETYESIGLPEALMYFMEDPVMAVRYAKNVMGKPFENCPDLVGEIKKDPNAACNYAIDVMKEEWPEAEDIIYSDARCLFSYCYMITGSRAPDYYEKKMFASFKSSDKYYSFLYKKYILKEMD